MPNEQKVTTLLGFSGISAALRGHRPRDGFMSVFVWTAGGLVLAACSGGTRLIETPVSDGGGASGGGVSAVDRGAFDGPVKNARIYIDLDRDGAVDEGEPHYLTDETGFAEVPLKYRGYPIIADVRGATDVESGAVLRGQFRSLEPTDPDAVLIATPLTDLLARAADPQAVLEAIFGAGAVTVTVADVGDPARYTLVDEDAATFDTSQQITLASIALVELAADPSLSGDNNFDLNNVDEVARVLREVLAGTGAEGLQAKVKAREDAAALITGGQPLAVPARRCSPSPVSRSRWGKTATYCRSPGLWVARMPRHSALTAQRVP